MRLWRITVPASLIPFLSRVFEPDAAGQSLVDLANHGEVLDHLQRIYYEMKDHEEWEQEVMMFRTGPTEVMRIGEPSFDLDYFELRHGYASARLRAAFALGPDEIAYRRIDTSPCTQAARDVDYEAFLPLKVANPFDPAKMPGRVRPVRQEDGSLREEWVVELPIPSPNTPATPIHFRPDFAPPAPLFRAMGLRGRMLATEEFADRVTRAGMTGIAFQEVEGERAAADTIYRDHG